LIEDFLLELRDLRGVCIYPFTLKFLHGIKYRSEFLCRSPYLSELLAKCPNLIPSLAKFPL
jgi:hypothetical protein